MIYETNLSEAGSNFDKYIVYEGGYKFLKIDKPLFSDIKIDELMNMTGPEIYKLWSSLPSDVLYNFSDFFNAQQLNALCVSL